METKYLDTLIESVDEIDTCEMLQEVYNDVFKFIAEQLTSLQIQGESFSILQKLLEIPKTIDDVLTWVQDFIQEYLAKVLGPLVKIQADIAILTAKLLYLQDKIRDKLNSIPACKIDFTPDLEAVVE
jgi:type I site-specific restriction-modification system R (restriction) subunit